MPTPTRPRRLAADHFRALAAAGLRTPIGTDLVLHERPDPEAVRLDGRRLAGVVREAAERYRTPLAIPLMDLRLEKADLVRRVRPDVVEPDTFHFDAPPSEADLERARAAEAAPFLAGAPRAPRRDRRGRGSTRPHAPRDGDRPLLARDEAARRPDRRRGPGRPRRSAAEDEPLVALAERGLALAELAVHRSLRAQVEAGAAAVIVCEPAASALFVSPRQIAQGSPVFERFVLEPLLRAKAVLDEARGRPRPPRLRRADRRPWSRRSPPASARPCSASAARDGCGRTHRSSPATSSSSATCPRSTSTPTRPCPSTPSAR